MENLKKYNSVFIKTFSIKEELLGMDFNHYSIDDWDSISQLALVNEIENEFDIFMDTDDILNFKSYGMGIKILKRYNIDIS